jgi:hypothetical protein
MSSKSIDRIIFCVGLVTAPLLAQAQTPPTAYTITEGLGAARPGTMTVYRSGTNVVMETSQPAQPGGIAAQHTLSLYDLKAGVSHTWNPAATQISCSVAKFSGDWGDPYASSAELTAGIAKGDLKPAGTENLYGFPTKVYAGASDGMTVKAWFDEKDGLIIKAVFGPPGGAMSTIVDIRSISVAPPPASIFVLPAACAGAKLPPTAADLMADETGDDGANWVNAIYGPGSSNSCSIVVHVVAAKTMAPINRKYQAAIDTTYDQNSPTPPHYVFGVGTDGTSTYSGGGLHEITNQIHNGILRIDNPPAYFMLGINIPTPNRGADVGLVYRQCFAPVTMLYWVVKDPANPADGGDWLYAKSGKYAVATTHY